MVNWLIVGWGTWSVSRHFSSPTSQIPDAQLPAVSILKPLKGVDEGLADNLESFFKIDYPSFEIIFSVSNPQEPALEVLVPLLKKYPNVNTHLLYSSKSVGPNPKINNLLCAYEKAESDLVLISDSNIRVEPAYLRRLIPDLKSSIGIITAVVAGTEPSGLGGYLEASYLNTFFARWMFITRDLGFESVVGKSMLFRKSTADRFGGLKTLGCYIAEDYMAGHAMKKLDLKVDLMRSPIRQYLGNYSFRSFWNRHLRWGRIRKAIAPMAFLIEPFFLTTVSGALGAFALNQITGLSVFIFWFVHLLVWCLSDIYLNHLVDRFSWKSVGAWWLREFLAFPLWLGILGGNKVHWRGKNYQLLKGGLVQGV